MTKSAIEWCDRSDWNPLRGCTRVSPGCGGPGPHGGCYAEAIAARFSDPGQPFHGFAERTKSGPRWTGKVELIEERLTAPLRWRKPARIFALSMSDLFHESVPDEWIDRIFAVMALCPQHVFQILTKRAQRMRDYASAFATPCRIGRHLHVTAEEAKGNALTLWKAQHRLINWPLPNVWLGVSVEDQGRADERIPPLLDTPAAVRWISAEPLLGAVEILRWLGNTSEEAGISEGPGIEWVIAGGESGPVARPMHPEWARSLRDQCVATGIPYFFKQWGAWTPGENVARQTGSITTADWFSGRWSFNSENLATEGGHRDDEPTVYRVGKKASGRRLDGREWSEYPAQAST